MDNFFLGVGAPYEAQDAQLLVMNLLDLPQPFIEIQGDSDLDRPVLAGLYKIDDSAKIGSSPRSSKVSEPNLAGRAHSGAYWRHFRPRLFALLLAPDKRMTPEGKCAKTPWETWPSG